MVFANVKTAFNSMKAVKNAYVHNFFHYLVLNVLCNVDNIKKKTKIINVNVWMALLLCLETTVNV